MSSYPLRSRVPMWCCLVVLCLSSRLPVSAQEHDHEHGQHTHGASAEQDKPIERPKIFLDKSPRIVSYQLNRLDNERLLLVERADTDPKYAPVYSAILSRAGISPQYREEAVAALAKINGTDEAVELLRVLSDMDVDKDRQQMRTARQLARMLLQQPAESLRGHLAELQEATQSESKFLRSTGFAGLVVADAAVDGWKRATQSESATLDWLGGVSLVPAAQLRATLRPQIVQLLANSPAPVHRGAISALAAIPRESGDFLLVSPFAEKPALRKAAVKTLLAIPAQDRDEDASQRLADHLVDLAEKTPAAQRTTDDFIDAMQLADQLLARLPVDQARAYRDRLREVTVRVVRINTVEEEMRYDLPYFVVEAGRPVQVVLRNEDLMPHNLVLCQPGSLKEVADLGLAAGPNNGMDGKQYVPHSDLVLWATNMVQPEKQERLTFDAPTEPGEYPYVCTFPRHWMRMYGVMVVVEDLDAWLKDPVEPKDPIGNNRAFVQNWKVEDLEAELENGMRGRSAEIGERIFAEATCAQCHKVRGQGGAVGPELTDVFTRWKGDRRAVLREILEPSHRIDPKYAVHLIITGDGRTLSGIVQSEDKESVSLVVNPEAKELTVVPKSDIEEMVKTSTSMMPKALLDRFSKDEIFELMAYLEAAKSAASEE